MSDVDFYLKNGIIAANNFSVGETLFVGSVSSQDTISNVTVTTGTIIDSFSTSVTRSACYLMQVVTATDYQVSELALVHNDIDSFVTEFGLLFTGNNPLATFSTDIVNNEVILVATMLSGPGKVYFQRVGLEAVQKSVIISYATSRNGSLIVTRDGNTLVLGRV